MAHHVELVELVGLHGLDVRECLRCLTRCTVGRVLFTGASMPAAEPVGFILDGQEVIFRTRNANKLAAATRRSVLGFQADEIDPVTYAGWSVVGVGRAYEIVDPERLADLAARNPDRWVPDRDTRTISIPLEHLTGRRLSAASTSRPHPATRDAP